MAIIPVFNYLSVVWQDLLKYLSDPGKLIRTDVSSHLNGANFSVTVWRLAPVRRVLTSAWRTLPRLC